MIFKIPPGLNALRDLPGKALHGAHTGTADQFSFSADYNLDKSCYTMLHKMFLHNKQETFGKCLRWVNFTDIQQALLLNLW